MKKDRELEKILVQFKLLENTMHVLRGREEEVSMRLDELHRSKLALKELEGVKESNALIPIGAGNFISGKISDSKKVLVGVGGGIAVKKTREESIDILDKKIKEMEKIAEDLSKEKKDILDSMVKLQSQIEEVRK